MTKQIDLKALLESKMGDIQPMKEAQEAIEKVENSIPKNLMFDAEVAEFRPETKAIAAPVAKGLTVEEAKQFDDDMCRFIDTVLISGVDYGVIPHCNKPTLLKSGAEKIMNYLGLIGRVEVENRVEDNDNAFFSFQVKVFLLDYNGVVRGEGLGSCNTREGRYAKQNGYAIQNTVLKMAKKRALVDGVLNVGSLSSRFTQDVEDMNIEPEQPAGKDVDSSNRGPSVVKTEKPASQKQIQYLESLMKKQGVGADSVNVFTQQNWGVEDYRRISAVQASTLISKFKALDPK